MEREVRLIKVCLAPKHGVKYYEPWLPPIAKVYLGLGLPKGGAFFDGTML